MENPPDHIVNTAVKHLHHLKEELNKAIKSIAGTGLEVQVEVIEIKDHGSQPIPILEISVKKEIYP